MSEQTIENPYTIMMEELKNLPRYNILPSDNGYDTKANQTHGHWILTKDVYGLIYKLSELSKTSMIISLITNTDKLFAFGIQEISRIARDPNVSILTEQFAIRKIDRLIEKRAKELKND